MTGPKSVASDWASPQIIYQRVRGHGTTANASANCPLTGLDSYYLQYTTP